MNIWTKFKELIPQRKYLIGEVTSIDATNKLSTITLLGGSSTTVKGTSVSVGNLCLIENGIIVQELPSLSAYSVTVY
jgi:hypothetical protein